MQRCHASLAARLPALEDIEYKDGKGFMHRLDTSELLLLPPEVSVEMFLAHGEMNRGAKEAVCKEYLHYLQLASRPSLVRDLSAFARRPVTRCTPIGSRRLPTSHFPRDKIVIVDLAFVEREIQPTQMVFCRRAFRALARGPYFFFGSPVAFVPNPDGRTVLRLTMTNEHFQIAS